MQKRFYSFLLTMIIIIGSFFSSSHLSLAATSTGDGTAESPYLIRTINDLYKIPDDPTAHYKIVNDLDLNNAKRPSMDEFQGVLDGDGHTIRNLTIVGDSDYVGLFSKTEGATIKNLEMSHINIDTIQVYVGAFTGSSANTNYMNCIVSNSQIVSTRSLIGGFAGSSTSSSYYNCYSINNIVKGSNYIGGLVGSATNTVSFLQCYSASSVEGTSSMVGGLLGVIENIGISIKECFASGNIKGTEYIGGLIGRTINSAPIIVNSYSICNLNGTKSNSEVSGLVGNSSNTSSNNFHPTIQNSYFAGEITGNTKSGLSSSGNITNSYFDKTITEISIPATQTRTTEEMYQKVNYSNWDFDTIWDIENGKGYPTLKFMTKKPEIPKPNDTAAMILIEKSEQLQLAVNEDLLVNDELDWSSSEETVATIDNTGFITAHALGETLITAKSKDRVYEESIYVMVVADASQYRMTVELKTGASCKVRIRGLDNSTISWNSMDSLTASVTENGKVKAISKGLTVLTAVDTDGEDVGQVYVRVR